jgi:quinol monooxygenase YgiN
MNARMVIAEPRSGHLDALVGFWDDETVAQITGQRGNRGFLLFQDAASGRVVALSIWESDADADAAGLTFKRHMETVLGHLASPPQVQRLDVAVASGAVLSTASI